MSDPRGAAPVLDDAGAPPLRIAIDASAAAVAEPSGVATYIRGLLHGLACTVAGDRIDVCYRLSRWRRRRFFPPREGAPNFRRRVLVPALDRALGFGRRIDVFHGADVRLPDLPGPATVATVHDLFSLATESFGAASFRRTRAHHYSLAARADRIITHSEAVRKQAIDLLGVSPDRIRAVPLAPAPGLARVAFDAVARARARHGLPERYVLFVGEVSRRKNVVALVRAFRMAMASAGGSLAAAALAIAGRPGHGAAEVEEEIARRDAPGGSPAATAAAIRLLGYVPRQEMPALLTGALALALPSRAEGFGIPVVEAFACGVPVVCSTAGALPEVAGDAAILHDPDDVDALARALVLLASEPSLRADLVRRGLERARAFTWEETARRTLAVYRDAARAARGAHA